MVARRRCQPWAMSERSLVAADATIALAVPPADAVFVQPDRRSGPGHPPGVGLDQESRESGATRGWGLCPKIMVTSRRARVSITYSKREASENGSVSSP